MARIILPRTKLLTLVVQPEKGLAFSTWELEKLMCGPLEVIDLRTGFYLIINPEGAQFNPTATKMASREVRGVAVLASRAEMGA